MWRIWNSAPLVTCSLGAGAALLPACRQDMHDQPRYETYVESQFFADGKAARELMPGTVPRGYAARDTAFYTGRTSGAQAVAATAAADLSPAAGDDADREQRAAWLAIAAAETAAGALVRDERLYVKEVPLPLTMAVLERGQERYEIFCAVCHDRTGGGDGMIVRRGYTRPPSLHSERLRGVKAGHFFDVMSSGFGAMPAYATQITPADRWAIVAYLRALQLSQWLPLRELPSAEQQRLEAQLRGQAGGEP